MVNATHRITVLVTAEEKSHILQRAKEHGLSRSLFLRLAASAFKVEEYDQLLGTMIDEMNITTAQASGAIDEALAFIETSNKRIEAMEKDRGFA